MVGTSGSCGSRFGAAIASARSRPPWTYPWIAGMLANERSTSPAISAVSDGDEPLYGMCAMDVFVRIFSSSAARCWVVPTPADE